MKFVWWRGEKRRGECSTWNSSHVNRQEQLSKNGKARTSSNYTTNITMPWELNKYSSWLTISGPVSILENSWWDGKVKSPETLACWISTLSLDLKFGVFTNPLSLSMSALFSNPWNYSIEKNDSCSSQCCPNRFVLLKIGNRSNIRLKSTWSDPAKIGDHCRHVCQANCPKLMILSNKTQDLGTDSGIPWLLTAKVL